MPVKKSALLLILSSVSSVSLLVYSSGITPPPRLNGVMPGIFPPATNCREMLEDKLFSPFEIISQMMLGTIA